MATQLAEDEIDDLMYFSRAGEEKDLETFISQLSTQKAVPAAVILSGAKDEGKNTCLHMATGNGHLGTSQCKTRWQLFMKFVRMMTKRAIEVPPLSCQLTLLPDVVKGLLQHFSESSKAEKRDFLDAANEYGNTGLHWAAMNGHLEVVKLLMEHGASPALANDKNYVPLDLASFNNKTDVVDFFLSQSEGMEGDNDAGLEEAAKGVELNGEDVVEESDSKS